MSNQHAPAALQIIAPEGERDAQDVRPRAHVPAAHLTAETIAEALQAAHGVMADAARRLGISRDTLYLRCHADPVVEAARTEAREVFIDLAELELYKLVGAATPRPLFTRCERLGCERLAGGRGRRAGAGTASPGRHVRSVEGVVPGGVDAARADRREARKLPPRPRPANLTRVTTRTTRLPPVFPTGILRGRSRSPTGRRCRGCCRSRRGRPDEIALNPGDVSKPE